ncbi:MAG: DUF6259 domain-containing protein [Acutalibacteraceae bacterium]|jgi:hypothetical protein
MIQVKGGIITVKTATQTAVFENGTLVSLADKSGREYIKNKSEAEALFIVYRGGDTVPLKNTAKGIISVRKLSDTRADVIFEAWDGDGVLSISEDLETGDILLEPEVTSARRGVLAARLPLGGLDEKLNIIAPLFQGVNLPAGDELLRKQKYIWPSAWEAGLVILQYNGTGSGFWVHTRDAQYRPKSFCTGQGESGCDIAFDAESYGPIDRNGSAGGLVWRINVFNGGWETPAAVYRDWLWEAYNLKKEERRRLDWTKDITLAVSWASSDKAAVAALAKRADPKKTLLHLPHWRKYKYDRNYPDFTPSDDFLDFLSYARSLGFHCMPHANSIDMDPTMPEYRFVQDYKYREIESGRLLGWGMNGNKVIGVPSSNAALARNRENNVMVKVHPGLSLWRSVLAGAIDDSLTKMNNMTDAIFLDVTLCIYNLENALVDNMTSFEGMNRLIEGIQTLRGGLAVGGEGLNEITMQHQSFGQAHLFRNCGIFPGLERCGKVALNTFLFGRLARIFAYTGISGDNEESWVCQRLYEEHGAIPTLLGINAAELENPNRMTGHILELAAQ